VRLTRAALEVPSNGLDQDREGGTYALARAPQPLAGRGRATAEPERAGAPDGLSRGR